MIAAVIKKWTDIDDPTMLRFAIRNDLRNNNFNAASVKLLADPLAASIRQWATLGERQKYDRAVPSTRRCSKRPSAQDHRINLAADRRPLFCYPSRRRNYLDG